MSKEIKTYEVDDTVMVHYLTGRPFKATVVERFKIEGDSYKGGLKYYPKLQEGEFGYRIADSTGTSRCFTRFDIKGKLQEGKLEPNPDYRPYKGPVRPTRKAKSSGPKAQFNRG